MHHQLSGAKLVLRAPHALLAALVHGVVALASAEAVLRCSWRALLWVRYLRRARCFIGCTQLVTGLVNSGSCGPV